MSQSGNEDLKRQLANVTEAAGHYFYNSEKAFSERLQGAIDDFNTWESNNYGSTNDYGNNNDDGDND